MVYLPTTENQSLVGEPLAVVWRSDPKVRGPLVERPTPGARPRWNSSVPGQAPDILGSTSGRHQHLDLCKADRRRLRARSRSTHETVTSIPCNLRLTTRHDLATAWIGMLDKDTSAGTRWLLRGICSEAESANKSETDTNRNLIGHGSSLIQVARCSTRCAPLGRSRDRVASRVKVPAQGFPSGSEQSSGHAHRRTGWA